MRPAPQAASNGRILPSPSLPLSYPAPIALSSRPNVHCSTAGSRKVALPFRLVIPLGITGNAGLGYFRPLKGFQQVGTEVDKAARSSSLLATDRRASHVRTLSRDDGHLQFSARWHMLTDSGRDFFSDGKSLAGDSVGPTSQTLMAQATRC